MYRQLGEGRLHDGTPLELGVVEGPAPDWMDRLAPFLRHKGFDYNYHTEAALTGPLDGLQTLFYVGLVDDQPITQVTIMGARRAGILAHVYTDPAWRQRGAYRQLMAAQMADIAALGYKVLTLITGYDSVPYHIYHSFGFRSVSDGLGCMRWEATPGAAADYMTLAETTVRPTRWDDWPGHNLAAMEPIGAIDWLPRLPMLSMIRQGSVETPFLVFYRRLARWPEAQSLVLESATGAVVGWCHLAPNAATQSDAWLLDLNALPAYQERVGDLLAAVEWPAAPVLYATTARDGAVRDGALSDVLTTHGFRRQATLPGVVEQAGEQRDVRLWLRQG